MPTINERNAAFGAAKTELKVLLGNLVHGYFLSRANAWLDDPDNADKILAVVDKTLEAAEKVRVPATKG